MTDLFPSRSPAQFAAAIAADVAGVLIDQPTTDLSAFVNSRYSRSSRGFVLAMQDGRTIVSERVPPPPMLARATRARLFSDRFDGRGGPSSFGGPERPRGGREGHAVWQR